ncbi:MAG: putative lipid II flippase FtsW [Armatimonadota bacterium]
MGSKMKQADFGLFATTIALLVIGLFMVYDSSYAVAGQINGNPRFFFFRQAGFAVVGLLAMFAVMHIPYWRWKPFATTFLAISVIGLVLVMVPGIGKAANGARRWIDVGALQIQPSEFAKLALVIYLASVMSAKKREMRDWKEGLLPLAVPVGLVGGLVVIEDLGTAVVTVGTAFAMLFIAGARKRHLFAVLGGIVPLGIFFVLREPYRLKRIIAFLDPFKDYHGIGYQVCQSLIALGSGGPLGKGICEGRQKLFYLPAQHTDFIFAVLGEEFGLIGTLVIAALFLHLAYRGIRIAKQTRDGFGKLLVAGIATLIAGQALLNMLVVTSTVPATGVPLPFISYGGSSLALNLVCIGVMLSVSRYPKNAESYDEDSADRRRNRRPLVSRVKRR